MTRLFVDAREVPCPPSGLSTLADVLRHVEQNHLPRDCVVRQVSVDGAPLGVDELEQGVLQMRECVEVFTGRLGEVAAEAVDEAVSYLERIGAAVPQLAANLEEMPGSAERDSLKQLYEGLFWLALLADRLCAAFHIDLGGLFIAGEAAAAHHRRFASVLRHLVAAQEHGDYGAIAATLKSDILREVPIWRGMFLEIGSRVRLPQEVSQTADMA